MIENQPSPDRQSGQPLPNSRKVYIQGKLNPEVRVPLREISLSPAKHNNGHPQPNSPLCVYDCSGTWGDAGFQGDVSQGLPPLRRPWIVARGDVEERPPTGERHRLSDFKSSRIPLRARAGQVVTQFAYARRGVITPESMLAKDVAAATPVGTLSEED